mgnify:CR=1 FL=1
MSHPQVSILLPVGPESPWLSKTLESLKQQTFSDWELIIVFDGNPEVNENVLNNAGIEQHTHVIRHEESKGIARSLNEALHAAQGTYVARMDADDLNFPERFSRQVQEFQQNPNLVLLGASAVVIDETGAPTGVVRKVPTGNRKLRKRLVSRNSFIHPTVMFKREDALATGGYNPQCTRTEDYELWMRMVSAGEIDNLVDPLIYYRVHSGQHTFAPVALSAGESKTILRTRMQLAKYLGATSFQARFWHALWMWNRSPKKGISTK